MLSEEADSDQDQGYADLDNWQQAAENGVDPNGIEDKSEDHEYDLDDAVETEDEEEVDDDENDAGDDTTVPRDLFSKVQS
jgi:hypothetical protein